jgi:protein O-mannosyl-transferase
MFPTSNSILAGVAPDRVLPGKSFSWLLLEKLPLLALSAGSAFLTMKAQWVNRTLGGLNQYSFPVRIGNTIVVYVRYLSHALWPTRLAFFYPHARSAPPAWQLIAALLLLLLLTWSTLASRSRRYLAVGWLWFLGTLVPMVELVQVGNHAMADRYGYVSFVGLFIAICWGIADWAEGWRFSEVWLPAGTIAVLLLLASATRRQLSYWTDDLTLWTHAAEAVSNNSMAENVIGETLAQRGQRDAAIAHYRAAAAMDPLSPFPRLHLGIYEEERHHPREAIEQLQKVIDLTQSAADHMPAVRTEAFVHMSFAYGELGDHADQEKYLTLAAQQAQP